MSAKKRRKKRGGAIWGSLSAIIICAALVLGVSVFFRVSNFEVVGASRYSEGEIIEASGIKVGSNLIFLDRGAIESRISKELVYVGMVTVSRKLPNTVAIEVRESGTVACIETESGLWLIDNYGRLLEPCPTSEASNYIKVMGFSALSPVAGQKIVVAEEDKAKADYLEDLLSSLYSAEMLSDVTAVDMSTSGNAQLDYLGRFKVKLGKSSELDNKLGLLKSVVEKLEPTDTGSIDLSVGSKAQFSPQ